MNTDAYIAACGKLDNRVTSHSEEEKCRVLMFIMVIVNTTRPRISETTYTQDGWKARL